MSHQCQFAFESPHADRFDHSLRSVIEKLDTRRAQVYVEALIVEVSSSIASEFGINSVAMFVPHCEVRYIVLGMPKLFIFNKKESKYSPLLAGTRLAGTENVTAAKLFVCATIDGKIMKDDQGEPEIFTLNLKSSRTSVLKAKNPAAGDGTPVA